MRSNDIGFAGGVPLLGNRLLKRLGRYVNRVIHGISGGFVWFPGRKGCGGKTVEVINSGLFIRARVVSALWLNCPSGSSRGLHP